MTEIVRSESLFPSRLDRDVARRMQTLRAGTSVQLARIESLAEVTEASLLAVSHISAVETCLIGAVPLAEPRLRAIADAGAIGLQGIVLRHARGVA